MLHIIKQYKQSFLGFILNELNNSNEGISSGGEEVTNAASFKDALSKALENGTLDPEEAKALLERLEGEKQEELRYTRESAKVLVDSLGVKGTDTWINKTSLKEKLKEISAKVKAETRQVKETVEKVINTDIFNRTLKEGMEGSDVMALQEYLILKGFLKPTYIDGDGRELNSADGKFGSGTKKALKKFQKSIGYTNPDGVLTVSNTKTYKTLATIKGLNTNEDYKGSSTNVYARTAKKSEVKSAIEKSSNSLDALEKLNKNSDEFYKALEAYYDGGFRDDVLSDMGGVVGWFREAVGSNDANEYFEKMKTYENKIGDKEDKFNDELYKILKKEKTTNKDGTEREYTTREESIGGYAIRDIIIMVAFQDVPLLDIRLNFVKNLVSHGVPMDKAKALKNWIDGGMQGEPDYSKENLDKISGNDSLKGLRKLRSTLTAYGFSNKQIDFALKGDLDGLTNKQKKALRTIIADRIIPDLETLRIGGFNFIERWFDDKDGEIKNRLNKLTGNKHTLEYKTERKFSNGNVEHYETYLTKVGENYILGTDDWGEDTYKIFDHRPTDAEIKDSIKEYNKGDEESYANGWNEPTSKDVDYGFNINGNKNPEHRKTFDIFKKSENEYILVRNDKYKVLDSKPTQDQINSFYENDLKDFIPLYKEGEYDENISIAEQLKLTGEIINLLKEQDTEDGFFGTEDGLTEGIKQVDSRYEYTKGIHEEYTFAKRAIETLEQKDSKLFKRFSMLSVFESSEEFLNAFPSSEKVSEQISKLKTATSPEEYVSILKEINKVKEVRKYFDIVFDTHKNNTGMNIWKKYRLSNIPKQTGLTKINSSADRRFKYGESLDVTATGEEALVKMKSETTEAGGNKPSMDILGNIVTGMVLKAGITDITTSDLESAIKNNWESIALEDLNNTVINTAKGSNFSNDEITNFPKLRFEKGDTHAFHTLVEKEITLFKKNGEKVTVTKTYDIFLRPECNNLLIVPGSNSQISKLNSADFNMDISSLKTPTIPITLNMLKAVKDAITPNNSVDEAKSMPIDDTPIDIPTTPGQPAM